VSVSDQPNKRIPKNAVFDSTVRPEPPGAKRDKTAEIIFSNSNIKVISDLWKTLIQFLTMSEREKAITCLRLVIY